MCCQVTNPPVGCFVLIEVNVIVDKIKRFFTVFLIKNLINCHFILCFLFIINHLVLLHDYIIIIAFSTNKHNIYTHTLISQITCNIVIVPVLTFSFKLVGRYQLDQNIYVTLYIFIDYIYH